MKKTQNSDGPLRPARARLRRVLKVCAIGTFIWCAASFAFLRLAPYMAPYLAEEPKWELWQCSCEVMDANYSIKIHGKLAPDYIKTVRRLLEAHFGAENVRLRDGILETRGGGQEGQVWESFLNAERLDLALFLDRSVEMPTLYMRNPKDCHAKAVYCVGEGQPYTLSEETYGPKSLMEWFLMIALLPGFVIEMAAESGPG